ncbi:MAG TPA: hypothetical protein VLJ19_09285 [Variovorax sp.]|nr:hypothetical protein [Variovorax sp.]
MRSVFGYIGITEVFEAAAEYDEFGGEQLARSLREAEGAIDLLADRLSKSIAQAVQS